ncbi:MAG: hypothetical protein AABN33_08215 [Acidobacteriota bacterium]
MKYNSTKYEFAKRVSFAVLLVASGLQATDAQENRSGIVRLFRLDGTFSTDLSAKTRSEDGSENSGFTLRNARLEADSMGFLTRLRTVLTIANGDTRRRITEVEWRLDVYDESVRSLSQRVLQADKVNIYPGETAAVSAKFGAVLPDRMIVLLQLVRVSFEDRSTWSPPVECWLAEDLRSVSCKSK